MGAYSVITFWSIFFGGDSEAGSMEWSEAVYLEANNTQQTRKKKAGVPARGQQPDIALESK